LSACSDPKKTPTYVCDSTATPASPPPLASAAPLGEALSVEEAGEEAKAAVAEAAAEVRAADGAVPLVTVEQTPAGPEIVSTPVANEAEAETVAEVAAVDGDLVAVEPDSIVTTDADPNDPQFANGNQYALGQLQFVTTWDDGFDGPESGANQTVAVLDTGVQEAHPDLANAVVLPGAVFGQDQPATQDPNGHGTFVAGIIAAATNNMIGVAGAAPAAKILPVKVLNSGGGGLASDVANGILWAADNDATVINLSLGGSTASDIMRIAVYHAVFNRNVPVISSSGNSGRCGALSFPAAFPETLAVGATDQNHQWASFSTTGPYVNVVAPGVRIWSTALGSGQYGHRTGTSFSAPYVAAAAAVVRAVHPGFSANEVYLRLITTAVDLGAPGWDPFFGSGFVNVKAAAA
jgi:subtilisin family serine protease